MCALSSQRIGCPLSPHNWNWLDLSADICCKRQFPHSGTAHSRQLCLMDPLPPCNETPPFENGQNQSCSDFAVIMGTTAYMDGLVKADRIDFAALILEEGFSCTNF